jgi:hypothetical protein
VQCLLCCYSPPRALAVPVMAAPVPQNEEWLSDGTVTKLWELLYHPHKEHGDVARDVLGGQALLQAHVHKLARALVSDKRFEAVHESLRESAGPPGDPAGSP